MKKKLFIRTVIIGVIFLMVLSACLPANPQSTDPEDLATPEATLMAEPIATPLPTRPAYAPGQLVDYTVQTGDTLPALAAHFNTTVKEIREANPIIPDTATTLPPGMPMQIPIYYQTLWGSQFQIIPDSVFINGPSQVNFDAVKFVDSQPGWFKNYTAFVGNATRRGGEIVNFIANQFSVSPQVLLALAEYQGKVLSTPVMPENADYDLLFKGNNEHKTLSSQLVWAANTLNNGYYSWKNGKLKELTHIDSSLERPDPWQNAASVALQYYFNQFMPLQKYYRATHAQGFQKTFIDLFGDPWTVEPHIPGSLEQPTMLMPFPVGKTWAYTGGPHTGWGTGEPWSAIDFAPPNTASGCILTKEFATAVADGVIIDNGIGYISLDMDGNGDGRTGWVVFYLHIETSEKLPVGTVVKAGDPVGHPSCEGGQATGTHIHIARKYNGEWMPADGTLAFNMEGWVPVAGSQPYEGKLTRYGRFVYSCDCANRDSLVTAGKP